MPLIFTRISIFLHRIEVRNEADRDREGRLFFIMTFISQSHELSDTAYYEPERRACHGGSRICETVAEASEAMIADQNDIQADVMVP